MKKEYRSSIRSKRLIKEAFTELLKTEKIDKITVVDIMEKADLSRNTFYSHYQDIRAVGEEIEDEIFTNLDEYLDEAVKNKEIDNPLPLLLRIGSFIEKNRVLDSLLLNDSHSGEVINRVKNVVVQRVIDNMDTINIKDKMGFLVYVEYSANGAIGLFLRFIKDEIDLSIEEISMKINSYFLSGYELFK